MSRPFPPYTERLRLEQLDQAQTLDKQHGRVERRILQASTRLAAHLDWPGVAQVCRIDRHTLRDDKQVHETAYAITSVPRPLADAAQLLEWKRGHWGIENRLHYVRDVSFGEDHSQIRKGSAPQCLAALRNAAITFLRASGVTNIAAALRNNVYQLPAILAKLGIVKQ